MSPVVARAHAAWATWILLCGTLLVVSVALFVRGLVERTAAMSLGGMVGCWVSFHVLLCAYVVWSYRRHIDRDPALRSVRWEFVGRNLAGVDLGGASPSRAARLVNGTRLLPFHLLFLGIAVLAAWLGSRA